MNIRFQHLAYLRTIMEILPLYLQLGVEHILSPDALDHQLFLASIFCLLRYHQRMPIFYMVSAFTVGHSLSLALSVVDTIRISSYWVELAIPVTIVLSGIGGLWNKKLEPKNFFRFYAIAGFFGLIHGLGFANTLKAVLGRQEEILLPLFGFNVGLEVAQLLFVGFFMVLQYFLIQNLKMGELLLQRLIASVCMLGGIFMIIARM